MSPSPEQFRRERERLNERVYATGTQVTKRFFNLDGAAFRDGKLSRKTKELLGLTASAVLRCDDCITYHLIRCAEEGYSRQELVEALDVALIVGGSITIPHLRRAHDTMDQIEGLAD
ncbi:MAG: carboxymuconolactone decarboxylase family protein [Planctomycetota bacterium]|nr:MAG: carboxymuconolactone decarboxylase family protein [Planctomycetota bacterium]